MGPYREPADLRSMQSLTQRLWSRTSRWHIGELAWMRYQHTGRESTWRTSLWAYGDEIVGWAWARLPGDLDLHLDPVHTQVAGEILRWFDTVADRARRTVTVLDAETDLITTLLRHGYREQDGGPFFVHLRRSLDDLPAPEVPAGYVLRPVRGERDAAAFSGHRRQLSPGHARLALSRRAGLAGQGTGRYARGVLPGLAG